MSTKQSVLLLLNNASADDSYLSGSAIADELKISRNSVWKAVAALKSEGYPIESLSSRGYRLNGFVDLLSLDKISHDIKKSSTKLLLFDTIDSTNNYGKNALIEDSPLVIIADEQTGGRGRYGRSFYSPKGTGIYMSYVFTPQFPVNETLHATTITAALIRNVIENVSGEPAVIKWVNDIYLKGLKIAGILTEGVGSFESTHLERVVIGIGINCFGSQFPPDIDKTAGSITCSPNPSFSRNEVIAGIINSLNDALCGKQTIGSSQILNDYRNNCFVIGKSVTLHSVGHDDAKAEVLRIDDDFRLVVKYLNGPNKGHTAALSSGEISITL